MSSNVYENKFDDLWYCGNEHGSNRAASLTNLAIASERRIITTMEKANMIMVVGAAVVESGSGRSGSGSER